MTYHLLYICAPQQWVNFSAQPPDNYPVGFGEQFPVISAYVETLPPGLIADEI